jgi:hypothetical protein
MFGNNTIKSKSHSRRLKSWNTCYHLVQNLVSSNLLMKNMKIKMYRTISLFVVLNGCETWSLPLKEYYRLKMFENVVLGKILELRGLR